MSSRTAQPHDALPPSLAALDSHDDAWLDQLRRAAAPLPRTRLGRYELLGEIGRGAQGVVLKARQPATNRLVALKCLTAGSLASLDMRARFRREVAAAAALSHPNIVTVYGSEEIDGQLVLAMEFVDGAPIDRWAQRGVDGARPVPEVLRVYLALCSAVSHAHQRGIIHRDLKPSNVLVVQGGSEGSRGGGIKAEQAAPRPLDPRPPGPSAPSPKVLDFGLAKVLGEAAGEHPLTATGGFVGTPVYAAPEQLSGAAGEVDVRADIYALGVILYQMLVGRLPFDLPGGDLGALIDAVRSHDPRRPSAVRRDVGREIDVIVLKALAKRPEERYQSVDALAQDVQRFLAGEPILAYPPSIFYHVRKLAARHRAVVWSGGVLLGVLLVFSVYVAVLARELALERNAAVAARERAEGAQAAEVRQRELADQRLAAEQAARVEALASSRRSEKINELITRMFALASPREGGLYEAPMRDVLKRAGDELDAGALTDDPLIEASLRATLASVCADLNLEQSALRHAQRAFELRCAALGLDHVDTAASLASLGYTLCGFADRRDDGLALMEQALETQRHMLGAAHRTTIRTLELIAIRCRDAGRRAEAIALQRQALEQYRAALHPDDDGLSRAMYNLGFMLDGGSPADLVEAETLLRASYQRRLARFGQGHHQTVSGATRLGIVLVRLGCPAEAEPLLANAIAARRAIWGNETIAVCLPLNWLAQARMQTRDYAGSLNALRESAALCDRPSERFEWIALVADLAGRCDEVIDARQRLVELASRQSPADAAAAFWQRLWLAEALQRFGRTEQAEDLLEALRSEIEPLVASWRERGWPDEVPERRRMHGYALASLLSGRAAHAEPPMRDLVERDRRAPSHKPLMLATSRAILGALLLTRGELDEAEPLLTADWRVLSAPGTANPFPLFVARRAAQLYELRGDEARAAEWRARVALPAYAAEDE